MDFNKARKKAKRIRHERTLLLIYAFAVTGALVISIHNNNNVAASTPKNTEISEMAPEEFPAENLVSIDENLKMGEENAAAGDTTEVFEEPEQTPQEVKQIVNSNGLQTNEDAVEVAKGDSFIGILTKMGLDYSEATNIYTAMKKVYDARNIKVGQIVNISSIIDDKYGELSSIERVMIEPTSGTRYIVERTADGKYEARTEQDDLSTETKTISGIIRGNVSSAMKNAGVPVNIVGNFINIFSFSVDFRRDVRAGDKFEVRYERQLAPNGKVVKTGDIVYASLTLGKDKTELYRFKDKSGSVDYFNEKGQALKKNLDRKPMEFKKARISSRFGRRFHPILKDYRNHSGVDYAAPMGTKVYASGDGVVTKSRYVNGYGNFISIRHNSEYTTGYGHLKSFAKGIRPGVRVKQGQVIAYVGNTGRSTGPHLHFEVVRNGRKVDPLKIKAATGENLYGAKLKEFKKVVAQIKAGSAPEREVAQLEPAILKTGNESLKKTSASPKEGFTGSETDQIGEAIENLDLITPPAGNI